MLHIVMLNADYRYDYAKFLNAECSGNLKNAIVIMIQNLK